MRGYKWRVSEKQRNEIIILGVKHEISMDSASNILSD